MNQYLILRNAGHNQVFFQNSLSLSLAELGLMGLPLSQIQEKTIAGLSYLSFTTETHLSPEDLAVLSRLSSLYGLFLEEGDLLRPVPLPDCQVFDRSLGTILKYSGKTNEIFTRMLLNIACAEGNIAPDKAKILDPVAGRGTTLFEGFALGADVYGMDIQEKSVADGYQHLKKFLEKAKVKHKTNTVRFSGPNKSFTAKRYQIQCNQQQFELVSGDSKYCDQVFSQDFFHLIVGDLPYGVQHGSKAGGLSRSPSQLLNSCGRAWHRSLKKGGVMVLSWNTLVLSREKMCDHLLKCGFQVLNHDHYQNLAHTVDASIHRDIIVATKG